jgi:hypothetical protein
MTELLAPLLPYIILGLFVLAVLLLLLSLQQLRRGRTGPYWRLRRAAGQRGGQLFLLSMLLFGVALALALFTGLADLAYRRLTASINSDPEAPVGVVLPSRTPTLQYSLTPTSTITATLTMTPTTEPVTDTPSPSVTPSPTATPTETVLPTLTLSPTATFENVLVFTPAPSARKPRLGATVEIVSAAMGVTAAGEPIEPALQFPAGVQRLYFFFDYRRMDDGITWTRILYREGVPIQGGSYIWSLGEEGANFFFFGSDTGYSSGSYKIQLFLGEDEVYWFEFSILSP